MKTIGVITMFRDNYGAFLQAYALQRLLIGLGYEAELINYDNYKEKTIFGIPLSLAKKPFVFLKRLLAEVFRFKQHRERRIVFAESIEEHLILCDSHYSSSKELFDKPPKYDIYLTGSDQVFNPYLEPQSLSCRVLEFASGVKVSYAASAGNADYIDAKIEYFLNQLQSFRSISVREDTLKKKLTHLLGKEVFCHVDPTLLLKTEDWSAFAKKPNYLPEKYIFYYKVIKDKKLKEEADRISSETGLPIFSADGFQKFKNQIKRKNFLRPEEWVGALLNADYVVTNSFHGTVFSVIFKKKALIVLPPSGKQRIKTLLSNMHLERLLNNSVLSDDKLNDLYDASVSYLNNERERAKSYLKSFKGF